MATGRHDLKADPEVPTAGHGRVGMKGMGCRGVGRVEWCGREALEGRLMATVRGAEPRAPGPAGQGGGGQDGTLPWSPTERASGTGGRGMLELCAHP